MIEITVRDWLSYEEAEQLPESIGGMGGWFKDGMRWKDFSNTVDEKALPYFEALRAEVIKSEIKIGGDTHQHDMTPLFSDNTVGSFSYRAWGDFMAAVWSEHDNKDYGYMDFYMTSLIPKESNGQT